MQPFRANTYLEWRTRCLREFRLGETGGAPSELLLQQIWRHQRLRRDQLVSHDGQPVRVWHPGFWNREPGPDFRDAIVQIGRGEATAGDIEIDLHPSGWSQHGHATNPAYGRVVLHVTWQRGPVSHHLPSVALEHSLDAPLDELGYWLGAEPKPMPASLAGKCSGPLGALEGGVLRDVLRQAAEARLQRKAHDLQALSRQLGWEGALTEALFAALGYKHNAWPMRQLAAAWAMMDGAPPTDLGGVHARLFGLAGFLESHRESRDAYVRQLWDAWWREADRLRGAALPKRLWRLAGIRPANHPERRLALAAHWLQSGDLPDRLEAWLQRAIGGPDLLPSLLEVLQARDPVWESRWTLRSTIARGIQPLLGAPRATDLGMNVILPWLYVRALAAQNERLAARAMERYFLWPAGEDNAVLRLARQRLFAGGSNGIGTQTAAEQQGLLQIVRDFCDHSNAACDHCPFPGLVSAIRAEGPR